MKKRPSTAQKRPKTNEFKEKVAVAKKEPVSKQEIVASTSARRGPKRRRTV